MLRARNRIERQEGFSNTMRLGSRAGSRALVVYLRYPGGDTSTSSAHGAETKVGIVVGKRQLPRAVDRNLVKRRLRHLLADRIENFPKGTRVVVRGLAPALTLTYEDLGEELDRGIRRAKRKQGTLASG